MMVHYGSVKNLPVIHGYLKRYQEDPTSRVFAPLAEAYRKAGLVDEAIEIAREGLQIHPHFVGGKVALARALFDKKRYREVLDELQVLVQDVPDNLVAQRLMGESYLMLGRIAEALGAFKMLLYQSPTDQEAAQMVRELEVQSYEKNALVLDRGVEPPPPAPEKTFDIRPAESAIRRAPESIRNRWMSKIQFLQELLKRVERYRATQSNY